MQHHGDIGLIGLAVMGQNLILNMNDHGYTVVAFNRTVSAVDSFLAGAAQGTRVIGVRSLPDMVALLKRPRKIMLMIKAGAPVDAMIDQLLPLCETGDCIIDGGNSHFLDTRRRTAALAERGVLFVGAGISGGEEGARHGPSIMPGGNPAAWPLIRELFTAIAAKTPDGTSCCDWLGADGTGHYVKMAHNAIEYGDMQIIAEAYHLLKQGLCLDHTVMHDVFARWNQGPLDSYLIEITAAIMAVRDTDGSPLVEKILDVAEQKGTGSWFSASALDLGVPVTLPTEAVYSRGLSALKDERLLAAKKRGPHTSRFSGDAGITVDDIERAVLAAKIVSYAQGFMCMHAASREYGWQLDPGAVALLWRAGCIIRSAFLGNIAAAFSADPALPNLLLDPYFSGVVAACQTSWRTVVAQAAVAGIPLPAISSALAFYDGYHCDRLPANLLQAQRDYFGAHTYRRIDEPPDRVFHTAWTRS